MIHAFGRCAHMSVACGMYQCTCGTASAIPTSFFVLMKENKEDNEHTLHTHRVYDCTPTTAMNVSSWTMNAAANGELHWRQEWTGWSSIKAEAVILCRLRWRKWLELALVEHRWRRLIPFCQYVSSENCCASLLQLWKGHPMLDVMCCLF